MIGDLPTFRDAGHAHTVYGLGNLAQGTAVAGTTMLGNINQLSQYATARAGTQDIFRPAAAYPATPETFALRLKEAPVTAKPTRRFVQVFIADTDDNIPLDQSMLYTGAPKLTDATDQELFFEVDIKALLAAHNEVRTKIINKKIKERTEFLEPARIRDLQMVVVNIASFG